MHPEVIGRGHRAAILDRMIAAMKDRAEVWFAARGCGSLRGGMTFPVHRSERANAVRARSGFRARAGAADRATRSRSIAACSRRQRRGRPRSGPRGETRHRRAGGDRRDRQGGGKDEFELGRQRADRDPRRPGPTECSVVGQGGLLAQNWDWHPDAAASTVVWIVEHEHGWFATLTEAGMLAKIGLNDAGLGVCLNLLNTTADGGLDGTPVHLLLRRTLARAAASTRRSPPHGREDERVLGGHGRDRGRCREHRALTRRRERHPRQRRRPHEPLPRAAAQASRDVVPEESPSTIPRLEVVRTQPLLDALRSHESHPKGVCRHWTPRAVGRADRDGGEAS